MKSCYYPQIEITGKDIINFAKKKSFSNPNSEDIKLINRVMGFGIPNTDLVYKTYLVDGLEDILKKHDLSEKDLIYAFPDSEGTLVIDGNKYKNVGTTKIEPMKMDSLWCSVFCILERRLNKRRNLLNALKEKFHTISGQYNVKQEVSLFDSINQWSTVISPTCKKLIFTKGVETIECQACEGCENLTQVTFPNTLKIIKDKALMFCSSLKSIKIPESVKIIGDKSFESCSCLKNVTIERGVNKIGNYAFHGCDLRSINIPGSVKEIGNHAFSWNFGLTDVTIEDGVECIGKLAFDAGRTMKEIKVPTSLKMLEGVAFDKKSAFKSEGGYTTYVPKTKNMEDVIVPKEKVQTL